MGLCSQSEPCSASVLAALMAGENWREAIKEIISLLFPFSFFGPFRYWSRRQAARTSLSLHLRLTPRSSIRSKRETANRIQAPGMKTRWNPNPQIKRTGVLLHTALLRPRRNPRKLQLTRIPNLSIQIRGPRVLMAALLWLSPNPAELKRTRI